MEVKERVINLIADKLGYNKMEINENQNLVSDLGCDSLDMVEIVMAIEAEFNIAIEDKEVANIITVGDAIKKVEEIHSAR